MPAPWNFRLGARYQGNNTCRFCVWAPMADKVEVKLMTPQERYVTLQPDGHGYHKALVKNVPPRTRYLYRIDGDKERPDPASRHQPDGVHEPSEVIDLTFDWHDDAWFGLPLVDYIVYELHVGTFTPEGTFEAIIPHLAELKELGMTAVELMPVAQFPGERNWGYDGVYLFGVQNSYGGPDGLKKLIDACHQHELAVILDVVYNHLGPEGNYLWDYGPYFTDRYKTPWGEALNFDGAHSDDVRRFFIENALYWFAEYHVDALRLDAIHAIRDFSAFPFLEELAVCTQQMADYLNRRCLLIAESDLNDSRVIRSRDLGGFGHDGQWSDDFHHAVHTLLTGESSGYYSDFGRIDHLVQAYRNGFAYDGKYSAHRKRRHGNSSRNQPAPQFVISVQNHDQVGNRMQGDRFGQMLSIDGQKLAGAILMSSPYIPMVFMGEEYGETAPFPYFVSHSDPKLVESVREGRKREFESFSWQGEVPDPQAEETFQSALLQRQWKSGDEDGNNHRILREWYQELIRLRKSHPALAYLSKDHMEVIGFEAKKALLVRRWCEGSQVAMIFHFGKSPAELEISLPAGKWEKLLDSADVRWLGDGSTVPDTLEGGKSITIEMPVQTGVLFDFQIKT